MCGKLTLNPIVLFWLHHIAHWARQSEKLLPKMWKASFVVWTYPRMKWNGFSFWKRSCVWADGCTQSVCLKCTKTSARWCIPHQIMQRSIIVVSSRLIHQDWKLSFKASQVPTFTQCKAKTQCRHVCSMLCTLVLASSPDPSQILSRSRGEIKSGRGLGTRFHFWLYIVPFFTVGCCVDYSLHKWLHIYSLAFF